MWIDIESALLKNALKHAEDRMNYEFDRFKQNDDFRFDKILIGTIGELVFKKFLDENNLEYSMEFQAGKYDEKDFSIGEAIYEIKTSGYKDQEGFSNLNLLYNADQYRNSLDKKFEYVVQIFINGYDRKARKLNIDNVNKAFIAGYIKFDSVKNFPLVQNIYHSNYKVSLNALDDIKEIID